MWSERTVETAERRNGRLLSVGCSLFLTDETPSKNPYRGYKGIPETRLACQRLRTHTMTDRRYDCENCGKWLPDGSRVDRRFCDSTCRLEAFRRARAVEKPCELCGRPFTPMRGRQRVCDFTQQAGTSCRELQNELAVRRREAEDARWDALCAHCGENAGWSGAGRPRRFCSPRCRTAFYRAEKRTTPESEIPA